MTGINQADIAFSIKAIYAEDAPKSGRIDNIIVLPDGNFIVSRAINGRLQYAKGQFSRYTLDYFTGLDTIQ
jgi:hypothetical protein